MTRTLALSLVALCGCALGRVRHVDVGPLAPFTRAQAAEVIVTGNPAVGELVRDSLVRSLDAFAHLHPAALGEPAYRIELSARAERPTVFSRAADPLWEAASALGLSGLALGAGHLSVTGTVYAPEGDRVGEVQWEAAGQPGTLADAAGRETAAALATRFKERRDDFVGRRAGDERLFLVPTPLTLAPGEWVLSSQELFIARAAVGVSKRLELDAWVGGVPLQVMAGTLGVFPHQIQATGAGGILFAGAFDLGLKLHAVEEGPLLPGISLSYDMLDVFGGAVGSGAGISIGDGVIAQAGAGGGVNNLQFNVFTATAGKHFGNTQLIGGAYFVDNHHFLPQAEVFALQEGAGPAGTSSANARELPMVPFQTIPFGAVEHVMGPHTTLVAELLPRKPWWDSVATTGVRWRIGFDRPLGPLALDRFRLTLDLAGVWAFIPTSEQSGFVAPMPYLGAGLYFM
ncbi:MAG TPA: hypothetical protein VH208_05635 [Myxococcaceae bacterium]|nr:hypothetical protein [Myxococcaceae bacterium]